jgi:hypothetical protein
MSVLKLSNITLKLWTVAMFVFVDFIKSISYRIYRNLYQLSRAEFTSLAPVVHLVVAIKPKANVDFMQSSFC